MSYSISKFQTISRHQSKLSQAPSTIGCLVAVLKYIKMVLTDDQTATLFQMINHHLETHNETAHHINLSLLNTQVVHAICEQFRLAGLYVGTDEQFIIWLLSNPEIYTGELPDDYVSFSKALSLSLALELFDTTHNKRISAHTNSLKNYVDHLMLATVSPIYSIVPETFETSYYDPFGNTTYQKLMSLLNARLLAYPSPYPIIDYQMFADTLEVPNFTHSSEDIALTALFFQEVYESDEEGVDLYQFSLDTIYAALFMGAQNVLDYIDTMADCGENPGQYVHRKQLDYYLNHASFVVHSGMSLEQQVELLAIRANVNKSYSKVYYIQTLVNKVNSTINFEGNIYKRIEDKTLDLINLVGLRKSIVAVSLVPYDVNGVIYNKIQISFDNYNPEFTATLADGIYGPISFRVIISLQRDKVVAFITVGDMEKQVVFDRSGISDIDPYFLFVIPRIEYPKLGTIRLQRLNIFGVAFDDEHTESLVAGFRQR